MNMKSLNIYAFCIFLSVTLIHQNVKAQQLYKSIRAHAEAIKSISINSSGTTILTGGADNRANLWEVKTGKKIKALALGSDVNCVAYHSSEKFFLTASGVKIVITDAKSMKPKRMLKGHTSEIYDAAFDPIKYNVVSGSKGGKVMIWDGNNGTLTYTCSDHTKEVRAVVYSPDGKHIASGSMDDKIIIWGAETGMSELVIEAGSKGINDLAYSADGKYLASAGKNGKVVIWNAKSGEEISVFTDLKSVNTVIFSPDVQYLAAGGDENKIIIWELKDKQIISTIGGHSKGITKIVFSDKGDYMVSGSNDGVMKIWDVKKLKIGNKKFVSEEELPELVCSPVTIMDNNNNGILEPGEKVQLKFTVENKGKGNAFNISAKTVLENNIKGVSFSKETHVGNIDANGSQEVVIPVEIDKGVETSAGTFIVSFSEANGIVPSPIRANFQTRGEQQYSFIMVMENSFTSATGKADIGAPITLHLKIKNVSKGVAKNIKIKYLLPENVLAVDKLSEIIEQMEPDETKDLEMQFYATEKFTGKAIKMMLDIQGAAFTNAKDMILSVTMKEALPGAVVHDVPDLAVVEKLYRGGGDPLKGLNISKSKEMVIGKYYALIVGVDSYKGGWPPLKNAVNDAKGIEVLLKQKYKFDVFKTLYNQTATRTAIIQQLEWLVANVHANDNVFIYYSGHGEYNKALNKGYWVPVDANSTTSTSSYISNSDLQTFLSGIKSKHTLLVSDACFSGDIFRGNTVSVPFEESEKYYKEVHNLISRQAITSGGIEPVMDGGKEGHSVFAYYFLKALKTNQSKYFDAGQLYTKIKIPVINNSEQTPKLSPIKKTGDEGGQFLFIKK